MTQHRPVSAAVALLSALGLFQACTKANQPEASSAPSAAQADHRAADEAVIRATDSAWGKAVAAKNADQIATYFADDASLLAPGAPVATGKDAIRQTWSAMMGTPGFALTFAPDKITVVGDAAYEIGEYQLTTIDKSGKPHVAKAKYITVWGKQPDGSWKAVIDAPTTTM
jgi:uncharacterized protein (TIGR02246 family)